MTLLEQIRANIRHFKDRAKAYRSQDNPHLAELCAKYEQEWRDREAQHLNKGARHHTR